MPTAAEWAELAALSDSEKEALRKAQEAGIDLTSSGTSTNTANTPTVESYQDAIWRQMQELAQQGVTQEQLEAYNVPTSTDPAQSSIGVNPDIMTSDGGIGTTSNEDYRAAKLAQDARVAAQEAEARAIRGTDSDPFRYNPRFNEDTAYFTDPDGNFGLGMRPENLYYNDYSGSMVEGIPLGASGQGSALTGGGGGVGGAAGDPNGWDQFEAPPNYQQSGGTGLPNGGIPYDYLLDKDGNGYWDQPGNGGNVPINWPGTGGGPNTPTGNKYTNWTGGSNLNLGGGGINVDRGEPPISQDIWDSLVPDKTGYESSSNKDFYQKQFQDMRTQEAGNDMREWSAAIRAQEAANAPAPEATDPWGWANLPEVQTGGSVGATPIEWGLNPNITSGMTNQQVVGALGPVLNSDEAAMLAENFRDNPDVASGTRWSTAGSPNPLLGSMGTNSNLDPNFANVLQKVFNNTYTQTGGGTGGISVPDGYANPTGG